MRALSREPREFQSRHGFGFQRVTEVVRPLVSTLDVAVFQDHIVRVAHAEARVAVRPNARIDRRGPVVEQTSGAPGPRVRTVARKDSPLEDFEFKTPEIDSKMAVSTHIKTADGSVVTQKDCRSVTGVGEK